MPSSEVNSLEAQPVADEHQSRPRMVADTFGIWNRKFHYYVGLYFLLFIWLFSFSGLMLNHHWQIATSWYPNRKQWSVKKPIQPLPEGTNLEKARNLMRQLDISGEVSLGEAQSKPGQFDFQAVKPGRFFQIHADLVTNQASVQIAQANAWGIMHMLHTFSGVRREDPRQQRNWIVTKIWTFSMDALALGLIFLVFSSYYMWYGFKRNRRLWGWITLSAAYLLCGFFVVGLKWLFS